MFGSRLRSWMENHIVRPRKKNNKNKNESRNITTAEINFDGPKKTDARGFKIYHGNGTTATSIKSSTAANLSCETSNQPHGCASVVSSPVRRREVSPIQNHAQSRYGWQSPEDVVTSPKSENFLYAPQYRKVKASSSFGDTDGFVEQQESSSQQKIDLSSSSFSSLSWSTGSKEPSMQSNNFRHSKTFSTAELMHSNSQPLSVSSLYPNKCSSEGFDNDPNEVHYEEIKTLVRQSGNGASNNNNDFLQERPKSERTSFKYEPPLQCVEVPNRADSTALYGRLLPSKMQPQTMSFIDCQNANHIRSNSFECIPSNNNHVTDTFRPHVQSTINVASSSGGLTRRNKLRVGRFTGSVRSAPATAAHVAPITSLSSPESAYSTGYSTDGTSPGAIYTPPEYYINMRTGTHYFPKSVNSLAIEAQRYKFGLNKIEEMSPQDPLPNTAFGGSTSSYRRMDPQGSAQNRIPGFGVPDPEFCKSQIQLLEPQRPLQMTVGCHSPVSLRNPIILPTLRGFESPSPRQRCRIRTNPWYSTTDTSSSGTTVTGENHKQPYEPKIAQSTTSSSKSSSSSTKKMETDAGSSSSSGAKSSSDALGTRAEKSMHNGKLFYDSESSSSLTEVENMPRTHTPNTARRKRVEVPVAKITLNPQFGGGCAGGASYHDGVGSDDEATLNEMMGKFDESYVYEKETDILSSDSDPTDCASDLDTGQDAGDECETDEMLEIDFIDNSSIQEICDRLDSQRNLGSCVYYSQSPSSQLKQLFEGRSATRSRRNSRNQRGLLPEVTSVDQLAVDQLPGGSHRRRKRFMKTRKKSSESREIPSPVQSSRGSRSVGGTPVSLRRNQSTGKERPQKSSPLPNRASSLVFMNVHYGSNRFVTIAESEKALLQADLEADVKYRQLIYEAESILVSMKSSFPSIPRDTAIASPHRVNPLVNKRVEMLKHCEADAKRDLLKQEQKSKDKKTLEIEKDFSAGVNRRIETLRCGTASVPNSPKSNRFSPRKTHLTNFINQNAPPEVSLRKFSTPDVVLCPPTSPQLKLNGRRLVSPTSSPICGRRFRSHSPPKLMANYCESDSDADQYSVQPLLEPSHGSESLKNQNSSENVANRNYLPEIARILLYDEEDFRNRNVETPSTGTASLMSSNSLARIYCPQSEPLKRKVYKGSNSFERLKKSFDLESEIPKQAMLAKINNLRRERQNQTAKLSASTKSSSHDINHLGCSGTEPANDDDPSFAACNLSSKKKLILLNTIEDLKRNLENQSVELNELHED